MKNYERYADEIREYNGWNFCTDFIVPYVLKSDDCFNNCSRCGMLQMIWLMEDYEEPKEPEIDWSKVETDTPILVRDHESQEWHARHFAKYEDGVIYTWVGAGTSWTSNGKMVEWRYAKLAESEETK